MSTVLTTAKHEFSEYLPVSAMVSRTEPAVSWYAAFTRSNFEKRASAELAFKGIESYLPVFRGMHRWKDRSKLVETPVFPGYVFMRMTDDHERQIQVLRTSGVVRILGQAGKIEQIPDVQIESIRRLLAANTFSFGHPYLQEGARVRVKHGALKDLEGFLIRVKNRARLVISISLLSQSVATEIDLSDIEVIR